MNSRTSGFPLKAKNTSNLRRSLTAVAGLLALGALCVGTQADAAPVHFRFVGGSWSHSSHSGWHRYWGGPSVGFYYAPAPVYVVPGYSAASYYTGSSFWYSDPSFGLSINLGGGGYSSPGYYQSGGHYYGGSGQRVQSVGGHSNRGGHSDHGSQDRHRG